MREILELALLYSSEPCWNSKAETASALKTSEHAADDKLNTSEQLQLANDTNLRCLDEKTLQLVAHKLQQKGLNKLYMVVL